MEDWLEHMQRTMCLEGFAPRSIKIYTQCLMVYQRRTGNSPLEFSVRGVEDFLVSLRTLRRAEATVHGYTVALKYFFRIHGRGDDLAHLRLKNRRHRLPDVLDTREVLDLLESCESLRYRTMFTLLYSAGLRVSELVHLRTGDLDFLRGQIHVRSGKGSKDRYTLLARTAADLVRDYMKVYQPEDYLFPAREGPDVPVSVAAIQSKLKKQVLESGIRKRVCTHTLRHSFATHLMEQGTNLFVIKELLGHSHIQTTLVYLHVRSLPALGVRSPLDILSNEGKCVQHGPCLNGELDFAG